MIISICSMWRSGPALASSYVANQEGTGGTLSVTDGAHTANIALLGQYSADGFTVEADGTSGTLLSYRSSDLSERWNVLIGPVYAGLIQVWPSFSSTTEKSSCEGSAERR